MKRAPVLKVLRIPLIRPIDRECTEEIVIKYDAANNRLVDLTNPVPLEEGRRIARRYQGEIRRRGIL